jgi:probable HAF family extracellular repeat protein
MRHTVSVVLTGLASSLALLASAHVHAEPSLQQAPQVTVTKPGITLTIQDGYEIVDLSTASGRTSYPLGIGGAGQVAGADKTSGSSDTRAVVWSAQGTASFPSFGTQSNAVGFAGNGDPVGYGNNLGIWTGFKGTTSLGGIPLGVGAGGRIVGIKMSGANTQAWAIDPAQTLKAVPGFASSGAFDANGSGVVVGYACHDPSPGKPTRAVRWTNGNPTLLPGKGSDNQGDAYNINDKGVIVGIVGEGDAQRAARWDNDQLTELGSLGGKSTATAINAAGTIVGYSADSSGDLHAVVFRNNKPVDLNTLVDRPTLVHAAAAMTATAAVNRVTFLDRDWFVQAANGINDKGEIAGYAIKLGVVHAVILKPVTRTINVASLEEVLSSMKNAKPARVVFPSKELRKF